MRGTLYVMVILLALGVWASPAIAGGNGTPMLQARVPAENRAGRIGAMARGDPASYEGTLSGTLIKRTQATSTWYLYPGACNDRAAGTWSPKTSPVADSLNSVDPARQNHGYGVVDNSLQERLWHIDDGSTVERTSGNEPWPLPIDGRRSLWCGKTDPTFIIKSGYPNRTYQILCFDTDVVAAGGGTARVNPYTLSWSQYMSSEFNADYMYVIGGSGGKDPIGNSRAELDKVISSDSDAGNEVLVKFTGSQVANQTLAYTSGGITVKGTANAGGPAVCTVSLSNIPTAHRAIYFVFIANENNSSQDGIWPEGHGAVLDLIGTSDEGLLYSDQSSAGGTDSFSGDVLVGTPSNPLISARVAPGVGTLWQAEAGSAAPTGDGCALQKDWTYDIHLYAKDPNTNQTVPNWDASVESPTFPVPGGGTVHITAKVWQNNSRASGNVVQGPEISVHGTFSLPRIPASPVQSGSWSSWIPMAQSAQTGAMQAWVEEGFEMPLPTEADSIRVRWGGSCIPFLAVDHVDCQPVQYGVIYDDLMLEIVTGVGAPAFEIFVGGVAQSNFVDGTDTPLIGGECTPAQVTAGQCWPGVRGSGIGTAAAVHDNVNSPLGDSIVVDLLTGLRRDGMGINWKDGFDKSVNGGLTIAHTNNSYNSAYDVPRIIYRLYDPTNLAWSPWDSSELDADAVAVSGADTVVIDGGFRWNWPPRDKVAAAASLPGGFTINGKGLYSQLAFLPKGCRMQSYYKAVDINGGVAYQFSPDALAHEVEDLPTLPGSSVIAPDIIEMDILPRVYPAGAAGTLLAGVNSATILNLDGNYTSWSNGFDPVTQALRAMGVRADRYRFLQGLGEGNNFGGHELPGQRVDQLSNYFPNVTEYPILQKLASNYRIIIQSSHLRDWTVFEEQDAILVHNWWNAETGMDGGDRCLFGSGDDMFNALLNASLTLPQNTQQVSLAQDVFGVASCIGAWTGANTTPYPTITDNFAGINYPVDGGCPSPKRFDGLTKVGSTDATVAANYPGGVTELAGVALSTENDPTPDNDLSKALSYGYSIQFIRTAGIPTNAANYVHTGVENRMRVLYKLLTSCRGQRTPSQTTVCWPCPSSFSDMTGNWAGAAGFNTAGAGPLYAIQDNTLATGVDLVEAPKVNHLEGNFPNPFNPETAIRFSAASAGKVTVRIFDVAGRVVNSLTKNVTETGLNEVRWNGKSQDGRQLASGVYFYKIRFANGQESVAKMTMLK